MILYDLVNPSDAVTFYASSREVALVVTFMLGRGMYAANAIDEDGRTLEDSDLDIPLFIMGYGIDDFLDENDISLNDTADDHRQEIIESFESFCTGTARERRLFESALSYMDDQEQKGSFVAEWDDRQRSSLNDITNSAYELAKGMKGS